MRKRKMNYSNSVKFKGTEKGWEGEGYGKVETIDLGLE